MGQCAPPCPGSRRRRGLPDGSSNRDASPASPRAGNAVRGPCASEGAQGASSVHRGRCGRGSRRSSGSRNPLRPMIVVADSGPLHYLILLDQTELLHRFYGEVIVPEAVRHELTVAKSPQPVKAWFDKPPAWLRIESVSASETQQVTAELDLGEREAIALAQRLR